MYTVGDCFAGIGGFSLVFHHFGCETAWFIENNPYCQQVLGKHFNAPIYGDIFASNPPHVDIFTAGFPCQPFSVAGQQRGEKDERYLVPEMLRVISEVKPNVILLENVPRFATINAGATFRLLLRELKQMGFNALWGSIRVSDCGASHKRERWFCVAYPTHERITFRDGQQGNDAKSGSERDGLTRGDSDSRGAAMVNATRPRLEREKRQSDRFTPAGRGEVESRLGRMPDGLSYRLDRHQFPALPSQAQFAHEAPRLTTKIQNRAARIKALGNSIVPQAWLPIAEMIIEWLDETSLHKCKISARL